MTKSPKAFRLSSQALDSLRWLTSRTGINETAVVEMSIAFLRQKFQPVITDNEKFSDEVPLELSPKKKRKRR